MEKVKFQDNQLNTTIKAPKPGNQAPDFTLVKSDLSEATLKDYAGKKVILNIFPSIDTGVCAASVRAFNEKISKVNNAVVLCISVDLPFAQSRFCGAENIKNVETLSAFRSSFGKDYGVVLEDSALKGLLTRAVIVVDENGKVLYTEVVPEITTEPNYSAALAALS